MHIKSKVNFYFSLSKNRNHYLLSKFRFTKQLPMLLNTILHTATFLCPTEKSYTFSHTINTRVVNISFKISS